MNASRRTPRKVTWIVALICVSFASIILVACSTTATPTPESNSLAVASNGASQPAPSNTLIPDIPTLPSLAQAVASHQEFSTALALNALAMQTSLSLIPHPTLPPGPFYLKSPVPTPTWKIGYAGGEMPENTFNPEYISCWYGILDDKLLSVCAGHEQFGGDPRQGVIRISVLEQDQVTLDTENIYETPGAFGPMHILVADSNSVTIASDDGQHIFTFDIATRQWISNPPSALPTASASIQK